MKLGGSLKSENVNLPWVWLLNKKNNNTDKNNNYSFAILILSMYLVLITKLFKCSNAYRYCLPTVINKFVSVLPSNITIILNDNFIEYFTYQGKEKKYYQVVSKNLHASTHVRIYSRTRSRTCSRWSLNYLFFYWKQ